MNKFKKYLSGFLAVAVLALIHGVRHGQPVALGNPVEEMRTYTFDDYQAIKGLVVDLGMSNLKIVQSDTEAIEVTYPVFKNPQAEIFVELQDDQLHIFSKEKARLFNLNGFSNLDATTEIALPTDYQLDHAQISLAMGSLELSGLDLPQTELALDMGSLTADQSHLGKAQVDLAMGSMEVTDTVLADGSVIDLDMGNLEGSLGLESGDLFIDVAMGSVDLTMLGGPYEFISQASMGSVDIHPDYAGDKLDASDYVGTVTIHTDMGSIDVR